MFATVLNSLLPVFLVIALGAVLSGTRFLPPELFKGISRLVYWVALPSLLLVKIATAETLDAASPRIVGVVVTVTFLIAAAAWLLAPRLGLAATSRGAFTQAAYRSNLAFVGLPVIEYALAQHPGLVHLGLDRTAILVLAPVVPVYNILSVMLLTTPELSAHRRELIQDALRKMLTNPLLIGCVLGLVIQASPVALPAVVSRSLNTVGQMALPCALLALGASLTLERLRNRLKQASLAALFKVVLAPLLGVGVARLFGLAPHHAAIAVLFLACPTAVASFVLADQMDADRDLAGSAVALSTIYALLTMSIVLGVYTAAPAG